jgi:hypothetical protein
MGMYNWYTLVYVVLQGLICGIPIIGGKLMATKQVAFRLDTDLLKKVDAFADILGQTTPGVQYTRVDAVRYLLTYALNDLQKRKTKRK